MNSKRLFVLLIGVAFFVALIISCLFIFSIKTVDTVFNVSNDFNEEEIQNELSEFSGKNLLSFKTEKVYAVLSKYPNVKVDSVKKVFPNVLEVKVTERLASYALKYNNETYILDNEGFVLEKISITNSVASDLIMISLNDIEPNNLAVGSKVSTNLNEIFYSAITISETQLSLDSNSKIKDCVTEINVFGRVKKAIYKTNSGVSIIINKPDEDGVEKAIQGFTKYHELRIDYYKTYDEIDVTKTKEGKIVTNWTSGETKK